MRIAPIHRAGRVVICLGMTRSGSTWCYHLARHLLGGIAGQYADDAGSLDAAIFEETGVAIIKCHVPADNLLDLVTTTEATVLISVRDPRDAAVSYMATFQNDWSLACSQVTACAQALVRWRTTVLARILRYEDGLDLFAAKRVASAIGGIAQFRVTEALRAVQPQAVKQRLALEASPEFDGTREWVPNHLGDGRVGKYSNKLTLDQQHELLDKCSGYCAIFGYEHAGGRC